MKPDIGISDKNLLETAKLLNILVADEFVLYAKTRNYHWNVTDPNFAALHSFFESQYEELDEIMDEVAERVRMLGHYALGTMTSFLKATHLTEDDDFSSAKKMIANLLADHETIIKTLRNDINVIDDKYKDTGTADFLTGVMEKHEKMAWMLRSHLK